MKKIVILGSTGYIGQYTLDVISRLGKDKFTVTALSGHKNVDLMYRQIKEYCPQYVVMTEPTAGKELSRKVGGSKTKVYTGSEMLLKLVTLDGIDLIVFALVGAVGLVPLVTALKNKRTVALANKESLVCGGKLIIDTVRKFGATLIPMDSEHSAIFQLLQTQTTGGTLSEMGGLARIILTASGGPLRKFTPMQLSKVTVSQALNHPKWKMGKKITVDSATLMNKGLEVIEAHFLFGLPLDKISVLIHPESIVHSLVEFNDGTLFAQLSQPDMRIPIQYAITYPERVNTKLPVLNLCDVGKLNFLPLNPAKYPCFKLALAAVTRGGTYPVVLNAANEVAVAAFLRRQIRFLDIPDIISEVIAKHCSIGNPKLNTIVMVDKWAREETMFKIKRRSSYVN